MFHSIRFLFLVLMLVSACGGEDSAKEPQIQSSKASASSSLSGMLPKETPDQNQPENIGGTIRALEATVTFTNQQATPRIINGEPVKEFSSWSCLDTLTVQFSKAMRLSTIPGRIYLVNSYNAKRALVVDDVDASSRRFVLKAAHNRHCNDYSGINQLVIEKDVRAFDGDTLSSTLREHVPFPANIPAFVPYRQSLSMFTNTRPSWLKTSTSRPPCSVASTNCFTVTPEALNQALAKMDDFLQEESHLPLYTGSSLKLLPLDYQLRPFSSVNRRRQYGNAELLHVLRRAARFTTFLFPQLSQIPVADLSEPDGGTPRLDDLLLHPAGSHINGRDADVAYITTGSGNDKGAAWDFEKNFWFLYGVLQSTGVDLVITAHSETFKQMAQEAYRFGLINALAAGRFNMLTYDKNMNHDTHMHVSVNNIANSKRSRKFLPSDDVYSCYLALRPDLEGGNQNFCGEPWAR